MQIRHLKIDNFRGIRTLDWHLSGRIICLIGPNDSTKSAILDALEIVLSPRVNIQGTDSDFHNLELEQPVNIEATIGEIPERLMDDQKFGLYLRGYEPGKPVHDDPEDFEPVITVRFSMSKELEPEWTVVKESQVEPRQIGWRDRSQLGLSRLGAEIDRHLTWARGSALLKLTEDDASIGKAFLEATRKSREIVANADLESLANVASVARDAAKVMGADFIELKPGLDSAGLSLGNSVLGLHQAGIPVRQWGLGTKRLVALAIQQSGIGKQSILLIDEIEHGLEPHRLRHLLKRLCFDSGGKEREEGQVIFSTHSPTSVIALSVENLRFVRCSNGQTTVTQVKTDCINTLQGIVRRHSPAFLGRKLLVCEGATEVGLCRGLEEYWSQVNNGRHPTHIGFVAIDGEGRTQAPKVALELKRVGYEVAVFADSDEPLEPSADSLKADGIPVFLWEGGMCTEQRLASDLPADCVQELLEEVYLIFDHQAVLDQIGNHCGINNFTTRGTNFEKWLGTDLTDEMARIAFGKAAKKKSWFKNVTFGNRLGEVVSEALPRIPTCSMANTLNELVTWVYD